MNGFFREPRLKIDAVLLMLWISLKELHEKLNAWLSKHKLRTNLCLAMVL